MNVPLMIAGFVIVTALSVVAYWANKEPEERDKGKECPEGDCGTTDVKEPQKTAEATSNEFVLETKDLVIETLKQMNSECEEREDGSLVFTYQGENFIIEASNDCLFINILDVWWYELSTFCDLKEFANMRKAVNEVNLHANCTVLYTVNTEREKFALHTRKNMIFIRQIPDLKDYLESTLSDFFQVQREVLLEIGEANTERDRELNHHN